MANPLAHMANPWSSLPPWDPTSVSREELSFHWEQWLDQFELGFTMVPEPPSRTDDGWTPAKRLDLYKRQHLCIQGGMHIRKELRRMDVADPTGDDTTFPKLRSLLNHRYRNTTDEYEEFCKLIDLRQTFSETFQNFTDKLHDLLPRAGFSKEFEGTKQLFRMLALRGTASPKLREAARLQKWSAFELVDKATEFESSTRPSQQTQRAHSIKYDQGADDTSNGMDESAIHRVMGRYSKQSRQMDPAFADRTTVCSRCGNGHSNQPQSCPAMGLTCQRCTLKGHFATQCKTSLPLRNAQRGGKFIQKRAQTPSDQTHLARNVEQHQSDEQTPQVCALAPAFNPYVYQIRPRPKQVSLVEVEVIVGGKAITAIADTGAQVNVLPVSQLTRELRAKITPASTTIQPYLAPSMPVLGTLTTDTTVENHTLLMKWLVVEDVHGLNTPTPALLSCTSCLDFNLITINFTPKTNKISQIYNLDTNKTGPWDPRLGKKYQAIFQGVGNLKSHSVTLHLRPGANPADFFSRHAPPFDSLPADLQNEAHETEKLLFNLQIRDIGGALTASEVSKRGQKDSEYRRLTKAVASGTIPTSKDTLAPYKNIWEELTLSPGGLVLRGLRIVLPQALYAHAVALAHGTAHLGTSATKRRLRSSVWFPGLDRQVENHVASCDHCQRNKTTKQKGLIQSLSVPPHPWHTLSIDLFGPIPDGRHVLVVRCDLSRFVEAVVIRGALPNPPLPQMPGIEEIRSKDQEIKFKRMDSVNNSRWRRQAPLIQGQKVLVLGSNVTSKLHSPYKEELFIITRTKGFTYDLLGMTSRTNLRRHHDSVKIYIERDGVPWTMEEPDPLDPNGTGFIPVPLRKGRERPQMLASSQGEITNGTRVHETRTHNNGQRLPEASFGTEADPGKEPNNGQTISLETGGTPAAGLVLDMVGPPGQGELESLEQDDSETSDQLQGGMACGVKRSKKEDKQGRNPRLDQVWLPHQLGPALVQIQQQQQQRRSSSRTRKPPKRFQP
ncbi:hypothetical protein TCAL_07344, partial [Tigriopus californicus]|eukprot:TCALIF_07344-PA protein Name:"Similar to K02A2.6 Uncharacterized protein K02A2.6 (Caenorhabditis elegans)" AED:0.16 eAED:0.20 QI:62/0/0/0.66/0/0/3/0/1006